MIEIKDLNKMMPGEKLDLLFNRKHRLKPSTRMFLETIKYELMQQVKRALSAY